MQTSMPWPLTWKHHLHWKCKWLTVEGHQTQLVGQHVGQEGMATRWHGRGSFLAQNQFHPKSRPGMPRSVRTQGLEVRGLWACIALSCSPKTSVIAITLGHSHLGRNHRRTPDFQAGHSSPGNPPQSARLLAPNAGPVHAKHDLDGGTSFEPTK